MAIDLFSLEGVELRVYGGTDNAFAFLFAASLSPLLWSVRSTFVRVAVGIGGSDWTYACVKRCDPRSARISRHSCPPRAVRCELGAGILLSTAVALSRLSRAAVHRTSFRHGWNELQVVRGRDLGSRPKNASITIFMGMVNGLMARKTCAVQWICDP